MEDKYWSLSADITLDMHNEEFRPSDSFFITYGIMGRIVLDLMIIAFVPVSVYYYVYNIQRLIICEYHICN